MGTSGAIKAGRAFVELFADDTKLVRGLKSAQRRLKGFQSAVSGMGTKILAGSAVVAGALGTMVKVFADSGDKLDKISARTGVTVEMLSKLGHAANASGADIDTLEKGLGALGRFMVDLKTGSKSAADMMGLLGLSMDALKDKTPDERVKILLKALSKIEDPSIRAGVAMKVLGRAGRALLPMADNFDALAAEAEKFGLVMSEEDTKKAAILTDAMGLLSSVLKMIIVQIGSSLAPMLIKVAGKLSEVGAKVIGWVKLNRELIVTVAKIVGIVAGAGAGLIALGLAAATLNAIIGVGIMLWTGIGVVIGFVGTLIGFLLSPIGLVIAGIVALAAYFIDWGSLTSKTLETAGSEFESFKDRALSAWGGIRDAIAAGDLKLAFRIVVLALKAEWIRVVGALKSKWNEWVGFFQSIWTNAVFGAAAVMTNAWAGLQSFWWSLTDGLMDAWSVFTSFIQKTWNSTVGFIVKAWNKLKSMVTGKKGRSASSVDQETDKANEEVDKKRNEAIMARDRDRKKGLAAIEQNRSATLEGLQQELEQREQARRDAQAGEIEENDKKLAEARTELGKAIEEAKQKREAKEKEDAKDRPGRKDGSPDMDGLGFGLGGKSAAKTSVQGTKSAFDTFAGFGSSSDPASGDRKKMIDKLDKIEKHSRKTSRKSESAVPML